MGTKKVSSDANDVAESLAVKLDLLDLAVTGLSTKCESSAPEYEEDIRPILELIWETKDKSRELSGWVSEARRRLKEIPAAAA